VILDRLVVQRRDDIAGHDAGARSRPVRLRLADQRTSRLFEADSGGDFGGYRADLEANPTARYHSLLLELVDHYLHGLGRDREADADRAT